MNTKTIKHKTKLFWRYILILSKKTSEQNVLIIISVIIGFIAAITVYLFEEVVVGIREFLSKQNGIDGINILYFTLPVLGIIMVSLFVNHVIKEPIGHGVTRVIRAISHNKAMLKVHNTFSSAISGAITIGFGGSVGPEAPIVMTGSAIGSNIAKAFRLNHRSTAILLACGAAAAVSAIFKAPITGVVFVLEILLIDMSMKSIIPILIASVTSTSIIYALHGFTPVFGITIDKAPIDFSHIPYYIILAILTGLASSWLIYSSSKIEGHFKKINKQYKKWILGGVVLSALIFIFPPLYGQGYDSINNLLAIDTNSLFENSIFTEYKDNIYIVLGYLFLITFAKSVAMSCTNAAGGVGGAFAPSLFMGAFTGYFTATILNLMFGLDLPVTSFTLIGMAGVMAGAMDSPLTAIFLIAEITGGYKLFLPLMLVSATSYAISYFFSPYSVYTRELILAGDTMSLTSDRSMIYIKLDKLIEDNFSRLNEKMKLGEIIKEVEKSNRNLFPVLNDNQNLVGYITLDDIRKDMFVKGLYDERTVLDYINIPTQIINSNDNISVILEKFDISNTWNLPVVDNNNKYMGFVSKSKIFSEYRNELSK